MHLSLREIDRSQSPQKVHLKMKVLLVQSSFLCFALQDRVPLQAMITVPKETNEETHSYAVLEIFLHHSTLMR